MKIFAAVALGLLLLSGGQGLRAEEPGPLPGLVDLPPFEGRILSMARTETTFDQWDACVRGGGCPPATDDHGWGRGNRPVINVDWAGARAFAAWLSARLGRACRLPSDAEWIFAARGGGAAAFWWGERMRPGLARCRGCSPFEPADGTMPVGTYPANPFGLFDMNGNLWEWVGDCADESCRRRITRGGAWYYLASQAQSDARADRPPSEKSITVGFRVLCEP